jgi:hypothetical protein
MKNEREIAEHIKVSSNAGQLKISIKIKNILQNG